MPWPLTKARHALEAEVMSDSSSLFDLTFEVSPSAEDQDQAEVVFIVAHIFELLLKQFFDYTVHPIIAILLYAKFGELKRIYTSLCKILISLSGTENAALLRRWDLITLDREVRETCPGWQCMQC
jgi:hypothetical protein